MPNLAKQNTCVGCSACTDVCAHGAITTFVAEDGHLYTKVDNNKCVECKRCEKVCVGLDARQYGDMQTVSKPYAVITKNTEDYARATSGGVFAAIAKRILSEGGAVYGAVYTDGVNVIHKRIDNVEDLPYLQGSKYLQSNLAGIYKQIKADLDQGVKVLFTGTGCQVAAVLAYFKRHKKKQLLYTMDLVCGGVPSRLLLEKYAYNTPGYKAVNAYRNKEKYVFSYIDENNEVVTKIKALPLDGFMSLLTNRYSCFDCQFTGIHRQSDWTIGDLWGDKSGTARSVCVCHNERSAALLEALDVDSELLLSWRFVISNPRLVNGRAPMDSRMERKRLADIMKHSSYKAIEKIYGSDVTWKQPLWFLYKVYKYIRFKRYSKNSKAIAKALIDKIER